jgi:hypothetical protein
MMLPRGDGEVLDRHTLAPQVLLDRLAILNDDDRLAVGAPVEASGSGSSRTTP